MTSRAFRITQISFGTRIRASWKQLEAQMGGSGGGTFGGRSPSKISQLVRDAELRTASAEFETRLSGVFGELLADFNSRDTVLVQERLQALKQHLEEVLDESLDHLFGGSVAKHTYVDGLSDVDSVLLINDTRLADG